MGRFLHFCLCEWGSVFTAVRLRELECDLSIGVGVCVRVRKLSACLEPFTQYVPLLEEGFFFPLLIHFPSLLLWVQDVKWTNSVNLQIVSNNHVKRNQKKISIYEIGIQNICDYKHKAFAENLWVGYVLSLGSFVNIVNRIFCNIWPLFGKSSAAASLFLFHCGPVLPCLLVSLKNHAFDSWYGPKCCFLSCSVAILLEKKKSKPSCVYMCILPA